MNTERSRHDDDDDDDDKASSIAGPRAWNALPSDIKLISTRTSFRKKLKTHFFSLI